MTGIHVLVAEDDAISLDLITENLAREGFRPQGTRDGASALRFLREGVDFAILDIGLPVIDGLSIVRTIRREHITTPILIVSGRTDVVDRVAALDTGADDYIVKPFIPREIAARVRAIMRRARPERGGENLVSGQHFRFGRLEIDEVAREVRVDGNDLRFRPREFSLISVLAKSPGVALPRHALIERAWGIDYDGDERSVDGHIRRIRSKLESFGDLNVSIVTIYGFGYKLHVA